MKKALLVGAILSAFAAQAHAESSVTLYGVVDGAYSYRHDSMKVETNGSTVSKTKTRNLGLQNGIAEGSSFWGLRGSEDLGNGTSAIFTLESEFNTNDGTSAESGKLFNKFAYVGLTGDSWGTFTIGNQKNVADEFMPEADPFGTNFDFAGAPSSFGDSLSSQMESSVKYMSPDFSGFQFGLAVAHNRKKTSYYNPGSYTYAKEGGTAISLGLKYSTDKLFLGAVYDTAKEYADDSTRVHSWAVGASYDFDVVKAYAAFGQQRNGMMGEIFGLPATNEDDEAYPWNSKGYRQNSWLVGLSAPVGDAGTVMFSYQGAHAKNNKTEYMGLNTPIKTTNHIFSLGYTYDLSKRTSVYGVASYGTSKTKLYGDGHLLATTKTKTTFVALGLKHAF
ncbi:porin [Pelistega europaea]|uniref:Porin n=1 Tax=Pelistega europaea TaxID=106147 RepID=A0A7Y4P425_9BURK|nr:porin [Pelistega europaea]NOL49051.1 porin [Pelistega europaea]